MTFFLGSLKVDLTGSWYKRESIVFKKRKWVKLFDFLIGNL